MNILSTTTKIIATLVTDPCPVLWHMPTKTRTVYLTFDDGPDKTLTPKFLDVLSGCNVKATFFLCAHHVAEYPEVAREIQSHGHTIGSHGYDHIRLIGRRKRTLQHQVLAADQAIFSAIHSTSHYFRPPYGMFGPALISVLHKMKKVLVLWDCNSRDYQRHRSPENILSLITTNVKPGSIILMHDGQPHGNRTLNLLPILINDLRESGFDFAVLP